jgi:hypothetical protein
MLISSALSGFSLNEADNLRKAMGKKKPEIMQKFSEQFVSGAKSNGCQQSVAPRDLGQHPQVRRLRLQQVALDRLRRVDRTRPRT